MSERGLGRGLDHLIEQNATELGFLDAYGSTPEEALAEIFDAACHALADLKGVKVEGTYEAEGILLQREDDGTRFTWSAPHLPLVASDLRRPGMREGVLSDARDKAEVIFVDWTHEVRRCLERAVEHRSTSS